MIVGVVGGGQLARMMIPPALALGVELRVLAEADGMAASLAATAVGDYRDADVVLAFAEGVDVVTFDHEHVPQEVLQRLVDAGVAVRPGPHALRFAQDKRLMRERMAELGVAQPDWAPVDGAADLRTFLDDHGGAAVVKTATGGYDGKGVRVVRAVDDVADWLEGAADGGPRLLVEELVPFRRELAQQVARRPSGEIVAWPLAQTVQRDGICAEVVVPAPRAGGEGAVAEDMAVRIAEGLDVTGALAVELFETEDGRLLVNELAMRPHNSGHWSIDGSVTSQFEQHLRAVLDLPLGSSAMLAPSAVMINVIGGPAEGRMEARYERALAAQPSAKVHSYGKTARPGRKVGHVTVVGDELDEVAYQARAAAATFE
ncbi:5-(carboxyamino)imidazole ribonucleotide synthase [Agrococcus sp. SGAir0287]|uniref:5-(carboxyamino)imidazole ribonucleotide synthase n=1 Tax=Agrococcus sp. SGAir0287 TaxID=2070347 RepID=UPI0010CD69DF|nr:5-(carboxyamino)imidazole ribonucleotide synthase [Agrococcus sp. SGAir0287]QCR18656.1 5-(carboxyamino)imidazole ribonucleotide synthase [Agrococcus sp. SGAir0287]